MLIHHRQRIHLCERCAPDEPASEWELDFFLMSFSEEVLQFPLQAFTERSYETSFRESFFFVFFIFVIVFLFSYFFFCFAIIVWTHGNAKHPAGYCIHASLWLEPWQNKTQENLIWTQNRIQENWEIWFAIEGYRIMYHTEQSCWIGGTCYRWRCMTYTHCHTQV
jgi:hypothetical protein